MTRKVFTILILTAIAVLLFGIVGGLALGDVSVEVADRYGFAEQTLDDGTIVQYIGDLNETFGAAGSGVFDSFVRLQGNEKKTATEKGYNTDGTREWDTKAGNFTHSILLSEIPTIEIGGQLYWEFFADINDSDSTPRISLDDFELYLTDDPNLTGYDFDGDATKIYDYTDANNDYFILINDVNQGSGRGDLRYLVPQDSFDLGDCSYGNPACTTYLVLYSVWGGKGGQYGFDGGFEEWKVKKYPILQVSKDIDGAYDTPVSWKITKDFDATYDLFAGETVTHGYEVSVDPTLGAPENAMVSGTITIVGDEDTSVDATISDQFNSADATITGCSVPENSDGTYTIAAGATVTCSYELALGGAPVDGTNVARATFEVGGANLAFQGSADILAGDYVETLTGTPDITVDDDNLEGEDWSASAASASWDYTLDFSCPTDESMYDENGFYTEDFVNTATIDQTGQSDSAAVTLNCYLLDVTKTADEFYSRYFEWKITKSVTPEAWNLFTGESGTSEYTVSLEQTGYHENDWQVKGNIVIDNPHPSRNAELTLVVDEASGITGVVDCDPETEGAQVSGTVPADGSLNCTYETTVQDSEDDNPFGDTNTATVAQQLYDFPADGPPTADGTQYYEGTAPIDFGEATVTLVDEEATVSDTYGGSTVGGTYSGDKIFTYSRTFTCDDDEGKHNNTASFETNDTPLTGSDDASVTVNCYDLSVSKDAKPSFTRTYEWTIDKVVDNPGPITLAGGQSVDVNYTITVDVLNTTDSDWAVVGDITIHNNHPTRAADLTGVTDSVSDFGTATVDCSGVTSVPAGGSIVCSYSTGLPNADTRTNTATATQQLYTFDKDKDPTADGTKDYSGSATVDFAGATINSVDEEIDVNDTYAGFLGTANALTDQLPKKFHYSRTITAPVDACGDHQFDNTATFTTNDTGATGSDSASVTITVPCEGCTPGFWQGGAGSQLWDEVDDPDWSGEGTNPFIHTTLFNDFFTSYSAADGLTMLDLVGTGGGSDDWRKAARDVVAAYLNASWGIAFPYTAQEVADLWTDAVNGDISFAELHNLLAPANDPPNGFCPIP